MAHIVPFRMAAAARSADETDTDPLGGDRTGAQIVIFPGVRRERHVAAANRPDDLPDAERASGRDWLELPDELPSACP